MPTSVVTVKGQTTIPKQMRAYLGVKAHDKLVYTPENGKVVITPLKGTIRGLKGAFRVPAWERQPMDFKKLRRAFEQARAVRSRREAP